MRGDGFPLPLASWPGTAPAWLRACAARCRLAIDMLARPQFEADQRPDTLRMIAAADFVLMQHRVHFARARPTALLGARVSQDVAGPADHPFLEPSSQRHAEAALRPGQHVSRHPGSDHLTEQSLGAVRVTVARRRLRTGDLDDVVIEQRT